VTKKKVSVDDKREKAVKVKDGTPTSLTRTIPRAPSAESAPGTRTNARTSEDPTTSSQSPSGSVASGPGIGSEVSKPGSSKVPKEGKAHTDKAEAGQKSMKSKKR